ncbi:MAG: hypothetical protein IPM35_38245 [Myxococcales bacterium]|nr:hypothetical protein [Myxococcales bacterium]
MQGPDDEDESASGEVSSVRVDLASLPDFADEELPDFSASSASQSKELPALDPEHELHVEIAVPESAEEPPVLGPEHEIHAEELPVLGAEHEVHEVPVLGAEHEMHEVEVPVLGPAHEVHDVELPVLGPEHEIHAEELPVLGAEHEVHDVELPVLGAEHEAHEEELPVLGAEHEVHEVELPVLGPEHEVHEEEAPVLGPEHELRDESLPDVAAEGEPLPGLDAAADADEDAEPTEAEAVEDAEASRNYRQIYETELRPLERDARIAAAHTADGSLLCALCLDPEPQVIRAILENSLVGLDHARLIARHHKNPVGLEAIVQRTEFARDTQVQRLLVRNNQLTDSLLRRLVGQKPLRELYKVAIDRDVAERNRVGARGLLRTRWSSSSSEERADFVMATEARCLTLLIGQTFDSRMTSILCGKQFNSVLFIQNLARFPACPPALLVHLLKQPFVRKSPALRKVLFQHPNVPSQAKRNL